MAESFFSMLTYECVCRNVYATKVEVHHGYQQPALPVGPVFSSQCVVCLSSGQPGPGPCSSTAPFRWSMIVPCRM